LIVHACSSELRKTFRTLAGLTLVLERVS
jgi:hypothetical protein